VFWLVEWPPRRSWESPLSFSLASPSSFLSGFPIATSRLSSLPCRRSGACVMLSGRSSVTVSALVCCRKTTKLTRSYQTLILWQHSDVFLLPTPTLLVGVGRIFESVCLSVCPQHNENNLGIGMTLRCTRSDVDWKVKGQGYRVNMCIFHTNSRGITQKRMIPKCSNLV